MTFVTATAMWFQKLIEVFLAIIIGEFFANLDVLDCIDLYLAAIDARFAIRSAGVIDVAGGVVVFFAVNRPLGVDVEQVAAASAVGFRIGYFFTSVFDNKGFLCDVGRREQAKAGSSARSLNGEDRFVGRYFFGRHG